MGAPDYCGSFLAPHPYGSFFASLLRSHQLVPNLPIERSMIKAVASRDLLTNVTRLVMAFWLSHSLSLNVRKCEMQVTMAVTVTTAPCETSSKNELSVTNTATRLPAEESWRNRGGLLDQDQAHSLGVLNTARSSFSLAPALVWSSPISLCLTPVPHHGCMYSQRAVSGRLISILSTRAPGVLRPKLVPLSFTRLNSTYRPRRICCHVLCSGK